MGTISKTPQESRLLDLCGTQLESLGYRVVDVDCHVSSRSLIRFFIERAGDEKHVATIEDCAGVSRALGPVLDTAVDIIPGAYELEVSSPGLDRRLRLASDFEQVVGDEVKLQLSESVEGRGSVKGKLVSMEQDQLSVLVDGKEIAVPLGKVRRANRVHQFNK